MTEDERWQYICNLDEEYLNGGVILSEWSSFLVKDSDMAFIHKAFLSCIMTSMAGVECHLRHEYTQEATNKDFSLAQLIEYAPIEQDLKKELHEIRRFRNKWVHVRDPFDDASLLSDPECYLFKIEEIAKKSG